MTDCYFYVSLVLLILFSAENAVVYGDGAWARGGWGTPVTTSTTTMRNGWFSPTTTSLPPTTTLSPTTTLPPTTTTNGWGWGSSTTTTPSIITTSEASTTTTQLTTTTTPGNGWGSITTTTTTQPPTTSMPGNGWGLVTTSATIQPPTTTSGYASGPIATPVESYVDLEAEKEVTTPLRIEDFRVHFGEELKPTSTFFSQLPQTIEKAEAGNWIKIGDGCKIKGNTEGIRYKLNDPTSSYILIFDVHGVVAGLQVLFPKEIAYPGNIYDYLGMPMLQKETINGAEYYVQTTYFTPPEYICNPIKSDGILKSYIPGTGLWFQNGSSSSELFTIPKTVGHALEEGWEPCSCIPGMGTHYCWKLKNWQAEKCSKVFPIMLMFSSQGKSDFVGYVTMGFGPTSKQYTNLEHGTFDQMLFTVGPSRAPECLKDIAGLGYTKLHVYFKKEPWTLACPTN